MEYENNHETNYASKGVAGSALGIGIGALGIVDSRGMVDVEGLADDLRNEIRRKGKLVIKIPLLGTFTFTESDVDTLYGIIVEG